MKLHHLTPAGAVEECGSFKTCSFLKTDHYSAYASAVQAKELMEARGYRTYAVDKTELSCDLTALREEAQGLSLAATESLVALGDTLEALVAARLRFSLDSSLTEDESKQVQAALRSIFAALAPSGTPLSNLKTPKGTPQFLAFLPDKVKEKTEATPLRLETQSLRKPPFGLHRAYGHEELYTTLMAEEEPLRGVKTVFTRRRRPAGEARRETQLLSDSKVLMGRLAWKKALSPEEQESIILHDYCHLLIELMPALVEAPLALIEETAGERFYDFKHQRLAFMALRDPAVGAASGKELFPGFSEGLFCCSSENSPGVFGPQVTSLEKTLRRWCLGAWAVLSF